MITDIIEDLQVRDWTFDITTINSCTLSNANYGIKGNMYVWEAEGTDVRAMLGLDDDDLLTRSSLMIKDGEWEVEIFKHKGVYFSVAYQKINSEIFALQLVSTNTAQFSNAQKELALILKSLNMEKLRVHLFNIDGQQFTSKIWHYKDGRLFCEDGICNLTVERKDVIVELMRRYRLLEKDDSKQYYKFETGSTCVQWLQVGNVIFYAICKHDTPLYEEIKEA